MAISIGTGLAFTIIYMTLMRLFPSYTIYYAVTVSELLFLMGIGACIYAAQDTRTYDKTSCWIGAAIASISFFIFNGLLLCYWSRVRIAITIIEATGQFINETKRILLVTFYYLVIFIFIFPFGFACVIGVYALNSI